MIAVQGENPKTSYFALRTSYFLLVAVNKSGEGMPSNTVMAVL